MNKFKCINIRDKYIYSDDNDNFPFGRSKIIHYKIKKRTKKNIYEKDNYIIYPSIKYDYSRKIAFDICFMYLSKIYIRYIKEELKFLHYKYRIDFHLVNIILKYLNTGDEDTLFKLYMSLTSNILKKGKMFISF